MLNHSRIMLRLFKKVISTPKEALLFGICLFLSQINVIFAVVSPLFLKKFFPKIANAESGTFVLFFLIGYGFIKVLSSLIKDLVEYFASGFLAKTFATFASDFTFKIMGSHPEIFANYQNVGLEAALNQLQTACAGLVFVPFFLILPLLTNFILVLWLVITKLPSKYFFIAISFAVIFFRVIKYSIKTFNRHKKIFNQQHLLFSELVGELFQNRERIFSTNSLQIQQQRLIDRLEERTSAETSLFKHLSSQKLINSFVLGIFVTIILWLAWHDFKDLGFGSIEFLLVLQIIDKLILPANMLNNNFTSFLKHFAYFNNFFKIIDHSDPIWVENHVFRNNEDNEFLLNHKLRIENITLIFKNQMLLENFSYTFQAPGLLVITGKNGTGKSLLLKTILGLFHPNAGEVFFSEIRTLDLFTSERNQIFSYLEQSPTLFTETIHYNLCYGLFDKENCCRLSHLQKNFLGARINSNLNFWVGKSGERLSVGEIAKIRIVNSLKTDCKILCWDEPSVALDAQSREIFSSIIKHEKLHRGLIIVTHDLDILSLADHVLQL